MQWLRPLRSGAAFARWNIFSPVAPAATGGSFLRAAVRGFHGRTLLRKEESKRVLEMELVGARELAKLDWYSSSDPYCIVNVQDQAFKTDVQENTLNPLWAQKFYVEYQPDQNISFVVMDRADLKLLADKTFGIVSVPMKDIEAAIQAAHDEGEKVAQKWFQLKPPSNDPKAYTQGRLYVNFQWVTDKAKKDGQTPSVAFLPSPLQETEATRLQSVRSLVRNGWEEPRNDRRPFRILSLDGGGVRGVFTAALLHRLVSEFPTLMDEVDLICGTSTGGLLALLLAAGYTPGNAQAIYETTCPKIFASPAYRRYSPFLAKYPSEPKEEVFKHYLGNSTLGDLKKYVLLTSFRLDGSAPSRTPTFFPSGRWRPALFSNVPRAMGVVDPDNDLSCVDCAMRTSAAPTYFKIHQGCVDGAIFANNPAMIGAIKAQSHYPSATLGHDGRISVLSLGSGTFKYNLKVKDDNTDWGLRQWAPWLLTLLMDSSSLMTSRHLTALLPNNYHRLEIDLPRRIDLDWTDDVPDLIEMAHKVDLASTFEFLRTRFLVNQLPEIQVKNIYGTPQ